MKNLAVAVLVALLGVVALAPAAEARGGVAIGIGLGGFGCCGYYPYYSPYYYGYPAYYAPSYYYAPPTVVYQQPAPVVYQQPAPAYAQPQSAPAAAQAPAPMAAPIAPVSATQASATYTDDKGRTCRQFQSRMEDGTPINGTACQQSDGSWRTVEQP